MKRMLFATAVAFALGALTAGLGSRAPTAQEPPARVTELLKSDLVGMDGKELIVQLLDVAPGVGTGKHYHPGHEVAYILEGDGAFEAQGTPKTPMKSGEVVYIPPRQVHDGTNTSATSRLKVLVFRIHEKGQPVTVRAE